MDGDAIRAPDGGLAPAASKPAAPPKPPPELLAGAMRAHARKAHAIVQVFYLVDALLLIGYGAAGTISPLTGWIYALVGCGLSGLLGTVFWRRGGRVDEVQRLTLVKVGLACATMVGVLAMESKVGGLMLMSLMAVLSMTAISVRSGYIVGVCGVVCAACIVIVFVAPTGPGFPTAGPVERALTSLWLIVLMLKAAGQNATGMQLRELVDRSSAKLALALREVEKLAATDELTTLPNRRSILGRLDGALAEAGAARPAVALLDIDHFKSINDRFGHEVGDRVLHRFGEVVAAGLRPGDAVGRYGGEEFLLVLPAPTAVEVAERLRERIAAHDWSDLVPGLVVTASVGVANVGPSDSAAAAIRRADAALYDAKRLGRDRVVEATAGEEGPPTFAARG